MSVYSLNYSSSTEEESHSNSLSNHPNSHNGSQSAEVTNQSADMELDNPTPNGDSFFEELLEFPEEEEEEKEQIQSSTNKPVERIPQYQKIDLREQRILNQTLNVKILDLEKKIEHQHALLQRRSNPVNNKKLDDWKGIKVKPFVTNMARHIQLIEDKIKEHGGVPEARKSTFLLSSLDEDFRVNVEGSYNGDDIDDISFGWLKAEMVSKYSMKGIITDRTETADEQLNRITMKSDQTVSQLFAEINAVRLQHRRSPERHNVEIINRMEKSSIDILMFRSCDSVQRALNQLQRKYDTGEAKPSNLSLFKSYYNYLLVSDPLYGKTKNGSVPADKKPDGSLSGNKGKEAQGRKRKGLCKYGESCRNKETCSFTHDLPATKKAAKPAATDCNKCKHRHPGACETCWSCHPDLKPSFKKK